MDDRFFRIIITGAGFSRPAGLPLANELWQEVLKRIDEEIGEDSWVRADIETFCDYKLAIEGTAPSPEKIDFEEFLAFLDVEHFLWLRGSKTFSSEGNETQLIVKRYIGQVIWEKTPRLKVPKLYLEFASRLKGGDTVITFNYDTLLEASLEAIGQPYRLFPERYTSIGSVSCETDSSLKEVVLLKPHGSVDWYDRGRYDEQLKAAEEYGTDHDFSYTPRNPVFGPDKCVDCAPIVDGVRREGDPLSRIFRVRDPSPLYRPINQLCTPLILPPSHMKLLYTDVLKEFWHGVGRIGGLERGMAIIGFSLPPHDDYIRQALYRLTRNYLYANWPEVYATGMKTKLQVVDLRRGTHELAEFNERFRFIDSSRMDANLDGFSEETLDSIFTTTPAV